MDDINRARATSFSLDENTPISSSVDGYYARLASTGTNDFGTIGTLTAALFYGELAIMMEYNNPIWNPSNPVPVPTGATLKHHDGNDARDETNRVRCIYNPNPPKTATRTPADNGSFTYTYSYE